MIRDIGILISTHSLFLNQSYNFKIYMLKPRLPFFLSVDSLRLEILFCGFQFSFWFPHRTFS
jgi:hypothetical protein